MERNLVGFEIKESVFLLTLPLLLLSIEVSLRKLKFGFLSLKTIFNPWGWYY
jgi:hypothetical protein